MDDIRSLRQKLVDVFTTWRLLGLPGEPAGNCRSPFREDRNPSFSVYADGRRWKDHSTGEGGDVLDFYATARGLSLSDAIQELQGHSPPTNRSFKPPVRTRQKRPEPRRGRIPLPKIDNGCFPEVQTLQQLRKLPVNAGIEILIQRGILWFTNYDGHRSWLLTDSSRRCSQVRRLDGKPIKTRTGTIKAKTLPGSMASWAIGAADLGNAETVILTEGGPDLLAAVTAWFLADAPKGWGFVAMLGASQNIESESVGQLSGRRVIITAHNDLPGWKAARQWAKTLRADGITAAVWLPPGEGMDLNDTVSEDLDRAIEIFNPNN